MNEPSRLIVPEQRTKLPVIASESGALISMLERVCRDPSMEISKMREAFEFIQEVRRDEGKRLFNEAMNAAQAEMTPIATNMTNPQTRSKYADYAQLDRAIRPIYTRHGFSISFDEADTTKPEHIRVIGIVSHSGGYERPYHTDMPTDGKGAKGGDVMTKTHAVGAGKSYGKRYILRDVFNLAIGEEDVDGNAEEPTIGPGQIAALEQLIAEVKADTLKLCRMLKVETLADIQVGAFETVKSIIEAKRGK